MRVNRGLIFWGVALVTAGAVALAIQYDIVAGESAREAWRLWPIVLIVIGVAVISAQLWARRFGSDPQVVGRTLRTETALFTVVGVGPTGFSGTVESDLVEFWMPLPQYLPASLIESRTGRSAWAIGRLAPGTPLAALETELAAVRETWAQAWPDVYRDLRLRVEPMGENWRSVVRGNIGAGGSDLTWGLDLTYLYDFQNDNSFAVGLKWLDIDFEKEQNFGIDAHFFGATIGYNFD